MLSFFLSFDEDGAAALTPAGNVAAVALGIAALLLVCFFTGKKKRFDTRTLVFSAAAVALAFALSNIRIFRMPLGGSVTLCSMLFVTVIGTWYGPAVGLTAAFTYGLLQFVQGGGSYMLSLLQVCLDYIFAFTALGVSGFFRNRRNGLSIGYAAGVLLRGFFHTVGGYLFWLEYMPEDFPASLAGVYPIIYNYAYLIAEAVITLVLLALPPVQKALAEARRYACGEG